MNKMSKKNNFGISKNESVSLIVRTCLENGVTDPKQIAYVLSTAQFESTDFTNAEEINGRSQAKKLHYIGGAKFFGRGYVQLTHKDNYEKFDRLLGLKGQLLKNPELAEKPEIAAKILVLGMRDGLFRKHKDKYGKYNNIKLNDFINNNKTDFYHARYIVNDITSKYPKSIKAATIIDGYAKVWEKKIQHIINNGKENFNQKNNADTYMSDSTVKNMDGIINGHLEANKLTTNKSPKTNKKNNNGSNNNDSISKDIGDVVDEGELLIKEVVDVALIGAILAKDVVSSSGSLVNDAVSLVYAGEVVIKEVFNIIELLAKDIEKVLLAAKLTQQEFNNVAVAINTLAPKNHVGKNAHIENNNLSVLYENTNNAEVKTVRNFNLEQIKNISAEDSINQAKNNIQNNEQNLQTIANQYAHNQKVSHNI